MLWKWNRSPIQSDSTDHAQWNTYSKKNTQKSKGVGGKEWKDNYHSIPAAEELSLSVCGVMVCALV